jgi:hypothetical protein
MTAPRTIALLMDFGLEDLYVGQIKGVLATLAPAVNELGFRDFFPTCFYSKS